MKVGVIGLGLIGGSIAKACLKAGWTVFGYDVNAEIMKSAATFGISVDTRWDEWAQNVDQIVLSTPLDEADGWIRAILSSGKGCTIVDVSSVKGTLSDTYSQIHPPFALLSIHPMAGKEVRGFAHSDAHLFEGRPCLVVEREGIEQDRKLVQGWMSVLGSTPVWVPFSQHDALMGIVSHTPYLVSAAILVLAESYGSRFPLWPEVAGTGFLDVTRIGASDPRLWEEILRANHDNVKETFAAFTHLIQEWNEDIQQGKWPRDLRQTVAIRRKTITDGTA